MAVWDAECITKRKWEHLKGGKVIHRAIGNCLPSSCSVSSLLARISLCVVIAFHPGLCIGPLKCLG